MEKRRIPLGKYKCRRCGKIVIEGVGHICRNGARTTW